MDYSLNSTFNDIYTSFYKKSFYFAKSYVHDDMVAEDIASESLIKLWEKLKTETIDYIEPFLFTILKNKSLDYLKHEAVKQAAFDSMAEWESRELSIRISTLESCDPGDIFSEEVERIVHDTMKRLPEQTRRIFLLSRFEDKSNKEISEQTGISVKGVEYHLTRALKALRITLKDYLPLFFFFFL